jgi:hypothetical protein
MTYNRAVSRAVRSKGKTSVASGLTNGSAAIIRRKNNVRIGQGFVVDRYYTAGLCNREISAPTTAGG